MSASREDILRRLEGLQSQQSGNQQMQPERRDQGQQEQAPRNQRNTISTRDVVQPGLDLVADFNTGLANLAGIFGTADELIQSSLGVQSPDSLMPTIKELREVGSNIGATRAPGVEADSVAGRFVEEVGAGAIPFIGAAAKTSIPLIRLAGAELTSAAGATGGGIALENSPSFKENPYMGRAVGELLGGISAVSLTDLIAKAPKTTTGLTYRAGKSVVNTVADKVRNEGARGRSARRAGDVSLFPETSAGRLSQPSDVDIETGIQTPATMSSDPGINRLTAAVMNEDPVSAEQLSRAFGEESQRLRAAALGSGDPDAVRNFLNAKLMEAGSKLDSSIKNISGTGASTGQISRNARNLIDNAYSQARAAEKRMWRSTPSDITVENPSAFKAWGNILQETTTETGRRNLPSVLKREFGDISKETGQLSGGSLPTNPTTKQLHELYSELGDLARSEADKAGGSAKKIRVFKDVRRALLDDLSSVDGGDRYRKAVNVSRQLNDRFTKGTVGNILGFSSRGTGTNSSETLDVILRTSGEGRSNAIRDLMKASPQASKQMEDYMRDLFVTRSVNVDNGRINVNAARKFLSENKAALDQFPDLRQRLSSSITDQTAVDDLVGKSSVGDLSIAQRERLGTGVYLKANTGEEIQRVLNTTSGRRKLISDLVSTVKEDDSGKAFEGLKSAFVDELFNKAGSSGVIDEFSQTEFVNGIKLKNRVDEFADDLIGGGVFTNEEVDRLKTISERLSNIQRAIGSRPSTGGVISDAPSQILSAVARIGGAQAGRGVAGRLGGGTVQTPGILSGQAQKILQRMTNDEARSILVRAVKDKDVMQDLLTNPQRISGDKQAEIIDGLLMPIRDTAEILPSAAARPAATAGQETESQQQREQVIQQLRNLQSGGQQ